MPAALEVDHEQVKIIAIQVGYREAARQLGLSEGTVICWAKREGWSEQVKQAQQAQQVKMEKQVMQSGAIKSPLEVMVAVGEKSKLVLAKTVHKTAKQLHKAKNEQLVLQTQALKATVDAGAKLHGWDTPSPSLTQINVNLGSTDLRDSPKQG